MTAGPFERRVLTAKEAWEQLRIPASTVRAAAAQGRLHPVAIDTQGRRWYRLYDLVELAATTRRRAHHTRPSRRRPEPGARDIA